MGVSGFYGVPGTTNGRIVPTGWSASDGSYVACLGSDVPGNVQRFNVGDYVEMTQTANFGSTKILRFRARTRPPAVAVAGILWLASVAIDGLGYAARPVFVRQRDWFDWAINVSKVSAGNHDLTFRLELVSI